MFAVLKTGGKQYRVQSGDVLRVEKLNAEAGDKVQFNEVLMIGSTIGAPLVSGAAVQAEVIDTIKADKVITYVKRRRKHSSQRTRGHRQQLTLIRVTDLLESGKLCAQIGLPQLNPETDRAMLCGSPAMLADTSAMLDRLGFQVSPHIGTPGDYVIERAFVEK